MHILYFLKDFYLNKKNMYVCFSVEIWPERDFGHWWLLRSLYQRSSTKTLRYRYMILMSDFLW